MFNYQNRSLINIALLAFCLPLLLQSCSTQNMFNSSNKPVGEVEIAKLQQAGNHVIQTNDKVSVSIWNHDDLSVGSIFGIYNSNEVYGKWVLVNENGEVNLPKIGTVMLGGLDTDEASTILEGMYSKYIKDPIIVVKVLNRKVSVLGEVRNPGSYLLEKEDHNLFEALAMAGGTEFYSDKKKVKLVRDGQEFVFDLTNMDDFTSNNIILENNDIIYVPTRSGKMLDKKAPTLIPFASVATTLILVVTLIAK